LFPDNKVGFSNPLTLDFLHQNQFLLVDTALFSETFKWKLIGSIEKFDEQCDGLLINSENFQVLNLIRESYMEKIKCIYIDPPYNTGGSGFLYKDKYIHSSWLSMILDRIQISKDLLEEDGVMYASIDAVERSNLENIFVRVFGIDNRVEEIIWAQNTTKNQSPTFSTNHEYVEVFTKNIESVKRDYAMFREIKPGYIEIMELIESLNSLFMPIEQVEKQLRELYKNRKNKLKAENVPEAFDDWKSIYNYNKVEYRDSKGNMVSEEVAKKQNAKLWVWREVDTSMPQVKEDSQKEEFRDPQNPVYRFYKPVHPITGKPCQPPKTGWRWPYDAYGNQNNYFKKLNIDNRIVWGLDEKKIPQQKSFLHEVETNVSKSVINDYADGEKELANVFGKSRAFSNPKPTSLIKRFCKQAATENKIVLDFFVGSGTTGHAVIDLNREDQGNRKYILVEMGTYFDTVTKPRIQKVVYSKNWKDGKPVSREGISHCFKYMRLESYEDTLNNLVLKQTETQQQALAMNPTFKEGYMLNYMLDVEATESLLNLEWFVNPFNCYLNITKNNELQPTKVDLVETFNYLIGLVVENYAVPKEGYVVVTGKNLAGESILIVWRDCTQHNSTALNQFLEKSKYNPLDTEYDRIYVNGDNNVENLKTGDERWKVVLIEEEFGKRMFENI
jgi:adenine-specific DNA-methyltransferase